jgi:hypothetical protein
MAIGRNQARIPREERGDPMNLGAIIDMFPIWRRYGQMLIDAGEVGEVTEERFRSPGDGSEGQNHSAAFAQSARTLMLPLITRAKRRQRS